MCGRHPATRPVCCYRGHAMPKLLNILSISVYVVTAALHAQPLGASVAAAHNDKLQKAHRPYKKAMIAKLSDAFIKEHSPYTERRQLCKWDDEWVECGYVKFSNTSSLTDLQKKTITEIMRNPCEYISFDVLKTLKPKYPDAKSSFQENKTYSAWVNQKHLFDLCQAGVFDATAVRIVTPHIDSASKQNLDKSKDGIIFEARIKFISNSQSKGK
jgi:hypothetical protein